jgi:hypothetical protein
MRFVHGHRSPHRSKTYISWSAMKQRCHSSTRHNANEYFFKGITYDARWESFQNFLADMGERPKGMTLDRIDSDGNYCKANCRWADVSTQNNNRRILQDAGF